MQPPYRPTSVSSPLPPSVKSQVDKAVSAADVSGVQTNVTVNVVNNVPSSSGSLDFLAWLILLPFKIFAFLLVLGVLITYPWLIAIAVIGGGVVAIHKINEGR